MNLQRVINLYSKKSLPWDSKEAIIAGSNLKKNLDSTVARFSIPIDYIEIIEDAEYWYINHFIWIKVCKRPIASLILSN